jgi:Zn-dependent M28 family amino/carboxypeptidase
VGTSASRFPHTGTTALVPGEPPFPAAALSYPDADRLEQLSAAGPVTVRLTLGCRWRSEVEGANVIGELEGSSRPGEIVLLGAHLDAWDVGAGAIDDAAGVGVVCETLRAIGALAKRPSRTVRVVLFANEENGSRGAQGYIEAHGAELSRHVLAVEIDLGTDRVYRISSITGAEGREAVSAMRTLLAPLGISESADDTGGGADTGMLRRFGVPLIELDQDATSYFDVHHSAEDTVDRIDPAHLAQVTAATAVVAYVAAESPATLGRIPEGKRDVKTR